MDGTCAGNDTKMSSRIFDTCSTFRSFLVVIVLFLLKCSNDAYLLHKNTESTHWDYPTTHRVLSAVLLTFNMHSFFQSCSSYSGLMAMMIITSRIQKMAEGNIFSLCVSPQEVTPMGTWGVPKPGQDGYPQPSAMTVWGTPIPRKERGGILATRQVVCFLRSCRRTFLLNQ